MEVFLARQPIFDIHKKVIAYEILYRSGMKNTYDISINGDLATASVVIDALINFGMGQLTSGKKAFINFTRKLLLENLPTLFEAECLTIEILETLDVDDLLIEKCKEFKAKGYTIALDDFVGDERFDALIPYVDIIKVDFLVLKTAGRKYVAEKYLPLGVELLAEKVETKEDLDEAIALGYHYFQGYFFEKPIMCKTKSLDVTTYRYMEILNETMSKEPDFNKMSNIIKNDFSLTYKLLRLINSPAFFTVGQITSVNHAVSLLGINEIRKWATLIMLRDISVDKPDELVKVSLVRAIFAERLAEVFGIKERETEAFLLGLFSLIDTVMEKPLFDIIEPLPLNEDLKGAILGENNIFHEILKLLKYYESGDWNRVIGVIEHNKIEPSLVNAMYLSSVNEATKMFAEM
ncbi:EAL and HDOD domain-containing protein [Fusibacter bizertensis]